MQVHIWNPQGSTKGHFFHEAFLDFQSCLLGCKCFVRPLNRLITLLYKIDRWDRSAEGKPPTSGLAWKLRESGEQPPSPLPLPRGTQVCGGWLKRCEPGRGAEWAPRPQLMPRALHTPPRVTIRSPRKYKGVPGSRRSPSLMALEQGAWPVSICSDHDHQPTSSPSAGPDGTLLLSATPTPTPTLTMAATQQRAPRQRGGLTPNSRRP